MKTTNQTTPKLRFPEFSGEWEVDGLGKVADFVNERIPLTKIKIADYYSTENILPDYAGVATASKLPPSGSAVKFKEEDILVSNIRPYLKKIWFANKSGGTSNDVVVIRAKENVEPRFLSFILKNENFIDYVMKGAKGVKMPRGDIALMTKYQITYPPIPEQQKIADCLSSLDDLITAENKKLDALKTHKKGLMQQLFPAEGETVPRLRFPEFLGDWRKAKLDEIALFFKGKGISKSDIDPSGNILCIRYGELYTIYGEVIKNVISKTNIPPDELFIGNKNDVLIPSSGETKIDIAKASCVLMDGVAFSGDLNVIRSSENGVFLSYMLNSRYKEEIAKKAQGDTVVHLYSSQLKQLEIMLPPIPEQQKIADFLSSVDELISAQIQKIDALKTHKKGLMQQLFPVLSH